MAAWGIYHASRLALGFRSQSPVTALYRTQQEVASGSPERSAWIGGHGTEPYEQNTQQSPDFGRSVAPQPVQV
jgi:hypothetical protein